MTFMDVSLTAIDGFGKELDSMHVFWVDGSKLKDILGERMRPADPWPAWYCHLSRDEARDIFESIQSRISNKSAEVNARMSELLGTGKSYIVRIEES